MISFISLIISFLSYKTITTTNTNHNTKTQQQTKQNKNKHIENRKHVRKSLFSLEECTT